MKNNSFTELKNALYELECPVHPQTGYAIARMHRGNLLVTVCCSGIIKEAVKICEQQELSYDITIG